jgi:hypothetical protein
MASTVRDILLVAAPLVGVWLSNWLTRAREVRQWRRDRCLEAYADVLRTNAAVVDKATSLYLEEKDVVAKRQDLMEQVAEFDRATQRALLLAPPEMEGAFRALIILVDKEIAVQAGACSKPLLDDWRKLVTTDIGAATGNIFAMCRRDLAIHPSRWFGLPTRMRRYLGI